MLVVGVLMVAVSMFAAGKPAWVQSYGNEVRKLMLEQNYTAARAYVDEFDWTASEAIKNSYVSQCVNIDYAEKRAVSGVADAQAQVGAYAAKVGAINQDVIDAQVLNRVYRGMENKTIAYDFFKSLKNPTDAIKVTAVAICTGLKKNDEALSLSLSLGNYVNASMIAASMKDKVKTFEYCRKAMLDQYCTALVLVQLLDRVGGFDYTDTTITKQMQSDLLQAVDLKYRRFLVKDKPTWEPIIAGIRLTLQGYGVEVK